MSGTGARRRARDGGSASLELLGMIPALGLAIVLTVQVAAALYALQATTDAVRQAARARSLGQPVGAAAQAALPGGLRVQGVAPFGDANGVRLTVGIPRILPIGPATVTREADLP